MRRTIIKTITVVLLAVTLMMMCAIDSIPALFIPISVNCIWFGLMLYANRRSLGIYEEN